MVSVIPFINMRFDFFEKLSQDDAKAFLRRFLEVESSDKRAYGAKGERERFVAGLEIPPVDSAQKAVQVQIVKDVKGASK